MNEVTIHALIVYQGEDCWLSSEFGLRQKDFHSGYATYGDRDFLARTREAVGFACCLYAQHPENFGLGSFPASSPDSGEPGGTA